jgi:hypothetical protein
VGPPLAISAGVGSGACRARSCSRASASWAAWSTRSGPCLGEFGTQLGDLAIALLISFAQVGEQRLNGRFDRCFDHHRQAWACLGIEFTIRRAYARLGRQPDVPRGAMWA